MSAGPAVLEAREVGKSYFLKGEPVEVLSDVSLSIAQGEYLSLMGQSGSGKSTLLNILGFLDVPTRGELRLRGEAMRSLPEARLAGIRNLEIGFVFQNFNLLPRLTLEANIELPLLYRGMPARERRERVREALGRFGLWERRGHLPAEVSGGQRQRAAIARALVKSPALILADEPTGNLDSRNTAQILEVFDGLRREGHTLVVITHDEDVASRADRKLVIADGRIAR